jgi:hypothetical protein
MKPSIFLKLLIVVFGGAALRGAVVLGLTHSTEVRGESGPAPVGPMVNPVGSVLHPDPAVDYLLHLNAEDFATYTHPVYGFSFAYPKDFELLPATWEDEEVIDLYHPTLPLGIRVSTRPFDPDAELFAQFASLPDEYDLEPPDGAHTNAVGWIDADVPVPGEHRGVYWFVAHDHLFEIPMIAPDLPWLQAWMHEFATAAFTLTRPSSAF